MLAPRWNSQFTGQGRGRVKGFPEDIKSDVAFDVSVRTHQKEKEMRAEEIKMPFSILVKQEN